jgi:hypothetical protein
MLYFDARRVSRKYDVSLEGNVLTWRRENLHFSQRMTLTIDPGGNRLVSKGTMSREGGDWEVDLSLTYTRCA